MGGCSVLDLQTMDSQKHIINCNPYYRKNDYPQSPLINGRYVMRQPPLSERMEAERPRARS